MWSSSGFFLRSTSLFSLYERHELLLYADDTCLIFQHHKIKEIEIQLNENFSLICDWFADNEIHFAEDKTKSILSGSKRKVKKTISLNAQHKKTNIKQYFKVRNFCWKKVSWFHVFVPFSRKFFPQFF